MVLSKLFIFRGLLYRRAEDKAHLLNDEKDRVSTKGNAFCVTLTIV